MDSPDTTLDPPRVPPSVTVALLKDAAARAAYVRSEIAALKAQHVVPLMSPGGTAGSPGGRSEADDGQSPATSYHSPWGGAAGNSEDGSRPESRGGIGRGHPPPPPAIYNGAHTTPPGGSPQNAGRLTSHGSPPARGPPGVSAVQDREATREQVMERLRHANAAMKENAIRKKATERKGAVRTSVESVEEEAPVQHAHPNARRESRVSVHDLAIAASKQSDSKPARRGPPGALGPPQPSRSPPPPRKAGRAAKPVAESRVSLAALVPVSEPPARATKPSRPKTATQASTGKPQHTVGGAKPGAPSRRRSTATAPAKAKGVTGRGGSYSRAAAERGLPGGRRRATKSAARRSALEDALGPWDGSRLDASVGVLLASVDRKVAADYAATASAHASRSPPKAAKGKPSSSGHAAKEGTSPAPKRGSPARPHEPVAAVSGGTSEEYGYGQAGPAGLLPQEGPAPPAVDPFWERDPEELARELSPDTPPGSASPVSVSVRMGEGVGGERGSGSHGGSPTKPAYGEELPPLSPSADSPTKMESRPAGSPPRGAEAEPFATAGSLVGAAAAGAALAGMTVDDVMREVAAGTVMDKVKEAPGSAYVAQPPLGRHVSRRLGLSRLKSSRKKNPGASRRMQLFLSNGMAVVAYRRGPLRRANHGLLQSARTRLTGNWEPGCAISLTTDSFTFHLMPTSSRDYHLWVLALNAALHYATRGRLDFGAPAMDVPLHSSMASAPLQVGVASLAQWAQ